MNLYHLKYFVDAATAGGISPAAKANFVTQSAISRAIANFERELEVDLILHKQNHFQLTEAGIAVLAECTAIIESVRRLKTGAADQSKTLRGPLRIAGNQAVVSKMIGPALSKIEAKYPAVKPEVKIGNTDQVQEMIEKNTVDFGIVLDDGQLAKRFHTLTLYRGEFVLVRSPTLSMPKMPENVLVSRTRKGGMSERYARAFEKAYSKAFSPKLVIPSWQVIMDLAIAGVGCALVPRFLCADELRTRRLAIVVHKVKPIPFELCAIVSRSKAFPKNAQALFEFFPKA